MPANLTPQYHEVERKFKEAKTPDEKLRYLREMFAVIPKHKGTEKLQADIKRRISKLQDESQKAHRSGRRPYAFAVEREGAAQMALVGPPNSGKSSILRVLTRAEPEVAPYPFTTRMPLPGMMQFEDIQIQLVDLPAVSETGMEHWAAQIVRGADALLVVLDLGAAAVLDDLEMVEAQLAEKEIYLAGAGGAPKLPPTSIIKKALVIGNKSDLCPDPAVTELLSAALTDRQNGLGRLRMVPFSTTGAPDTSGLRRNLFELAEIIRVYTKVPGRKPDMDRPFVLPAGSTLMEVAALVHKDFVASLKFARLWGSGAFEGQCIQKDH
ncbi:MAG: 50S ribosome-binding GTPase, partial [Candidatus Eisenbacteria bacterium]|nr:50S ribosome-binding GTPase [Candidatus Eisenbacteria bacterium]